MTNQSTVKTQLVSALLVQLEVSDPCGCCDQDMGNDCCAIYKQLADLGYDFDTQTLTQDDNQHVIVADLQEMTVPQILEYKEFIERLFQRVRDTHFDQDPLPNQVPEAWNECVQTINAIQEALFLKTDMD